MSVCPHRRSQAAMVPSKRLTRRARSCVIANPVVGDKSPHAASTGMPSRSGCHPLNEVSLGLPRLTVPEEVSAPDALETAVRPERPTVLGGDQDPDNIADLASGHEGGLKPLDARQ